MLKSAPWTLPAKIRIVEGEPTFHDAYEQWLKGKNPTSDPAWKDGVFLGFIETEEVPS